MSELWTLDNDLALVETGLASGRSPGSIKSRRAQLCNPLHPACIRFWLRVETLPPHLRPQLSSLQSLKRDWQDEPVANSSAATGSTLAAGQQQAIEAALEPGNAVITGGAGTGKSFVAGLVAARLRGATHRGEGEVALCALTGIAALTLGNGANRHARARARAIRVHTLDFKRLPTRRPRAPPPLPCVRRVPSNDAPLVRRHRARSRHARRAARLRAQRPSRRRALVQGQGARDRRGVDALRRAL